MQEVQTGQWVEFDWKWGGQGNRHNGRSKDHKCIMIAWLFIKRGLERGLSGFLSYCFPGE
jgi:hypothetical protein